MYLFQIDAKELEKEKRIEEALKRIERLNVSRSESPEVCRTLLPLEDIGLGRTGHGSPTFLPFLLAQWQRRLWPTHQLPCTFGQPSLLF